MADIWSRLPMLPMQHILNQLGLEDALAAASACRQWRQALSLYEGKRESLKLRATEPERSEFLAKLFRRNARKLHIHLDCPETDADEFLHNILYKFRDTALLHELLIAGPAYMKLQTPATFIKIKRSTVESILQAHRHTLQNVAFIGCELSSWDDAASVETGELSGKVAPSDESMPTPFLTKVTVKNLQFLSLQSLTLEYNSINSELLEALCTLPHLSHLSLNLENREGQKYEPLPWNLLENKPSPLEVSVNIIGVPCEMFEDIMENVLVDNLPLVAIRVLFCKVLHEPFILHILKYDKTLRVFHWADTSAINATGTVLNVSTPRQYDSQAVNPFIILCWRCGQLTHLTIHGYWVWQYDLLGMARLRYGTLQQLEVSATYHRNNQEDFFCKREAILAVVGMDKMPAVKNSYVEQMNQCLEFDWRPTKKLSAVHSALGPNSSPSNRAEYILTHTTQQNGVTSCYVRKRKLLSESERERAAAY